MAGNMMHKVKKVTIAASAKVSAGFTIEPWAIFYGALFPAMDDGAVGLELTIDGGTSWNPVLDPIDGGDAVLCASGSDPGWIDFSDWVRFMGDNDNYQARFVSATTQSSGAVVINVMMRG